MANLLQGGKRGKDLSRVKNGRVHCGQQYADQATERGTRPPLMYTLTVAEGFGHERTEYTAQFTEAEMIAITSEWLTAANRRRIDAEFEAKRKAEVRVA